MFDDYLITFLWENLPLLLVVLFVTFTAIKISIFLFSEHLIVLDMAKTKWARDIPAQVLSSQGDIIPENLTGWFPLCLSDELGISKLKASHVFGMDLVMFRSTTGKVHVLDAYCPHMGTYLPVGGKVVGEDIRCPFHGWTFDGQGQCSHVPGLEKSSLPKAKIRSWTCIDINGVIMIWYDSKGRPPKWMPMKNPDIERLQLSCKAQLFSFGNFVEVLYNPFDFSHFNAIHSEPGILDAESVLKNNLLFRLMTMLISVEFLSFVPELPVKGHLGKVALDVGVTVLGKRLNGLSQMELIFEGPYIVQVKVEFPFYPLKEMVVIETVRPMPGRKFNYTQQFYSRPGILSKIFTIIFAYTLRNQVLRDLIIFSNKVIFKRPHFAKHENDLAEMARHIRQMAND